MDERFAGGDLSAFRTPVRRAGENHAPGKNSRFLSSNAQNHHFGSFYERGSSLPRL
jgi:hypothetical protein